MGMTYRLQNILQCLKVKHLKQSGTIVLLAALSLVPFNNCANQANDTGVFKKSLTSCDGSDPDCDLDPSQLEIGSSVNSIVIGPGQTIITIAGTCNSGTYPINQIHWKINYNNNELPGGWNSESTNLVGQCSNGSFSVNVNVPSVPDFYFIILEIRGITSGGESVTNPGGGVKSISFRRTP